MYINSTSRLLWPKTLHFDREVCTFSKETCISCPQLLCHVHPSRMELLLFFQIFNSPIQNASFFRRSDYFDRKPCILIGRCAHFQKKLAFRLDVYCVMFTPPEWNCYFFQIFNTPIQNASFFSVQITSTENLAF